MFSVPRLAIMRLLGTFLILASGSASYASPADRHGQLLELRESSSNCTYQYISQPIDHYGNHNGRFQQRYNLVTQFFKAGGPILLYQGDETDDLDCVVESTIMYSWAKELNGIAVSLEHRYFGESAPFGATNPVTQREEFNYLTLDNIMANAAYFVNSLKKNITGAENSKVIVASGSYGGFLATVMRQNHPESFWGAIASAPVLTGWGNNTNMTSPSIYDYAIWVNNVYQDRSAQASANIKNAFGVLEERFQTGNLSSLKEEMSLCSAPRNMSDSTTFSSLIRTIIYVSAEFNYAAARSGRSPVARPMEKITQIALNQKDPIQIFNETLWMWFGSLDPHLNCLNWTSPPAVVPGVNTQVFSYIGCGIFPAWTQAYVPEGTIFPAALNGGATRIQACDKLYNVSTPSPEQLEEQYRITPGHLRNSTRITWSLAQYDPSSSVSPNLPGVNAPLPSADRNVSRVLYTTNMAHREDLFAPMKDDRDTVVQARQTELESIKGWLGLYDS